MSSENLFYYRRRVKAKDEEGKETEFDVWDCFNVYHVLRAWWENQNTFSVMLADGHEEARDIEKPIVKDGKLQKHLSTRERAWYVTKIDLVPEDALRFRKLTDVEA